MKNKDYAKISSDNVKFLLIKRGVSVRQLADKIGIAPTTLNDSLKSKKGIPIDSLIKIADLFGVTVNDLCNTDFQKFTNEKNRNEAERIMNKYRLLDSHGREITEMIIEKELERILNEEN